MKKVIKYLAIFSLLGFANLLSSNPETVIKEDTFDESNLTGELQVKRNAVIGDSAEVSVSKTYVQHGTTLYEERNVECLRFVTAVKGNFSSLTYSRLHIDGIADVETKEVSTVYKGVMADNKVWYYDGTDITTDEAYAGQYYWAAYTIRFINDTYKDTNITVNLSIDGEKKAEATSSLNGLIHEQTQPVEKNYRFEAEHLMPINPKTGYKISNKTEASLSNMDPVTYGTTPPSGDNFIDHINNVEAYEIDLNVEKETENAKIYFALSGSAINQENKISNSIKSISVNGIDYSIDSNSISKTLTKWYAGSAGYGATFKLNQGYNKIRINPVTTSTLNFDYIEIKSDQNLTRYDVLEGENNFKMKDGVDTTAHPPISGASGWGKRTSGSASGGAFAQQGQFLKFDFNYDAPTARTAKLYVSCIIGEDSSVTGNLTNYFTSLKLNGNIISTDGVVVKGSSWYNGYPIYVGTIELIEGNNTIDITTGNTNFSLDYISII